MTYAAVLRKACSYVVRIGGAVEICQMARYTRGWESGEHVVFVTLSTRDIDVGARQGERRIVVAESRRVQPVCR
jgi:hypothetical protein